MTLQVTYGSSAVEFDRFLEYSYRENYLEASDQWSFTVAQKELSGADLAVLQPGADVTLIIDGKPQSKGIIDEVDGSAARGSGNVAHITGRDWLSVAVD